MIKVLFVCMGNICRSPTAEGVFRAHVEKYELHHTIFIDSAGTHSYHVGNQPDRRAQEAAKARGIDLSSLRARRVSLEDYEHFDYILAMDRPNYEDLCRDCPMEFRHKVQLFMSYAEGVDEQEVPDPYYGAKKGFEHVLDLVEAASEGLLKTIKSRHKL